jgi:hypothetical protein
MDPLTAILGPWGQFGIFGSIVIALGTVVVFQWQHIKNVTAAHLADVKEFGKTYADVLLENSKTNTALANAIERIGDKLK